MAASITPLNQETLINPYSNKIFDFDTHSSKVYVSRSVNNLLKSIGDDCVLDGLTSSATYDADTNIITIKVDPGKAIVDSTLVEITSPKTLNKLELDVTPFLDSGFIVLALSYKFLNTMYSNLAKLRLFYVAPDSTPSPQFNITNPDNFQIDYDRLILAKYTFNKTNKSVNQIVTTLNSNSIQTIKAKNYYIYPRSKLLVNSFDEIKNLFTILNYD